MPLRYRIPEKIRAGIPGCRNTETTSLAANPIMMKKNIRKICWMMNFNIPIPKYFVLYHI